MKTVYKALLSGASLIVLASAAAEADIGSPVTQTATLSPQPTNLCAITGAVTAQVTCTVTVGSNNNAYITAIYFDVCTNGTGTAQNQASFTSSGIQNNPTWPFSVAATAGICQHWGDTGGPQGVLAKGIAPGTNIVITSPSATTNNSYAIRVYGYLAP